MCLFIIILWPDFLHTICHYCILIKSIDSTPQREAYPQAYGPIHMYQFHCNGEEQRLTECNKATEVCQHNDEAGVQCTEGKMHAIC